MLRRRDLRAGVREDGTMTRRSGPTVTRSQVRLTANPKRVIARLFIPGNESRVTAVLDRVLALSGSEVKTTLHRVLDRYSSRHKNINLILDQHYGCVAGQLNGRTPQSLEQRRLIGSYFTSEYSLESVALFNPSIVPHPDQNGAMNGETRFILSLRACGEGHISSIQFRSGTINAIAT